mgnify:CR=1 FL=1
MVWIKNTKAWMLMRGILALAGFILMAASFTDAYDPVAGKRSSSSYGCGGSGRFFNQNSGEVWRSWAQKQMLTSMLPFDSKERVRFSDETVDGIVRAVFSMSKVKTGALIVVEQLIQLTEYESTGIQMDCLISSQVLINIFEHNTPLHDGAIIVRNDRIVAATCYLPLSDNMELSKDLGTRHRAAVGISEVTDSLTVVVSEETGRVSVVENGKLRRNFHGRRFAQGTGGSRRPGREQWHTVKDLGTGKRRNERKTDK